MPVDSLTPLTGTRHLHEESKRLKQSADSGGPISWRKGKMETEDPEVQAILDQGPPKEPLSKRFGHGLFWGSIIIAIIAILIALAGIGYTYTVAQDSRKIAACINTNLGARNQPNLDDKTALKIEQQAEIAALEEIFNGNPKQGLNDYAIAIRTYNAAIAIDDARRAANPIGSCG